MLVREITSDIHLAYEQREEEVGGEVMRQLERRVVLAVMDRKWREHLYEMDYLKEGIGLRAMAQRDPVVEYRNEGYGMFTAMDEAIKEESVRYLFNLQLKTPEEQAAADGPVVTVAAAAVPTPPSPGGSPACPTPPHLRHRRPPRRRPPGRRRSRRRPGRRRPPGRRRRHWRSSRRRAPRTHVLGVGEGRLGGSGRHGRRRREGVGVRRGDGGRGRRCARHGPEPGGTAGGAEEARQEPLRSRHLTAGRRRRHAID
jgi:preprotein translocase subunit SecA